MKSDSYPPELLSLKGTRLLFKVEKDSPSCILFDDSFRVKRVCKDLEIISKFHDNKGNYTPVMACLSISCYWFMFLIVLDCILWIVFSSIFAFKSFDFVLAHSPYLRHVKMLVLI